MSRRRWRSVSIRRRTHRGGRKGELAALLVLGALLMSLLGAALAQALPDNRAYELVTRLEENGHEAGLNGDESGLGFPAVNGEAFAWEGIGPCCGASTGGVNLLRSERGAKGWTTQALTPAPIEPQVALYENQTPVYWDSNITKTIWATPSHYAPGDKRSKSSRATDLYLRSPEGALTWLSQGPFGSATEPFTAEFDAATPNVNDVVFNSGEPLTANATPLNPYNNPRYLYLRDVAAETTTLLDVDSSDELLGPAGATLGNGGEGDGTTTHALSEDGSKVFFETPPEDAGFPEFSVSHLYMRDLENGTTTPLDNPNSSGYAQFEGASADGSLVFFTSTEGLDGAGSAKELYVYNTTSTAIGVVPAMSSVALGGGTGVVGESAIANDGSHVYYVAQNVLAANSNSGGQKATVGEPNLYVTDIGSGQTTFVATLVMTDVNTCSSTCGSGSPAGMVAEPDVARAAYPTPDGSVLVFESSGNETGQNNFPTTTLTAEAKSEERTLTVASTQGFLAGHTVAIGTGSSEELYEIESVVGPTELKLTEYGPGYRPGLVTEHPVGSVVMQEALEGYRYSTANNELVCITCAPAGTTPTGYAVVGVGDGGSYGPPTGSLAMNETASEIFFDSTEALVPEAVKGSSSTLLDVYEWEDGKVSLLSTGTVNAFFEGTTASGDDAFFATHERLNPGDPELHAVGPVETYDARVNGGFPAPPELPTPCSGQSCRSEVGSTFFFAPPASAMLMSVGATTAEGGGSSPSFSVAQITATQRARLIRTGSLTLSVTASGAAEIEARVMAKLKGKTQRVAYASSKLSRAARVKLTLHLNKAARRALNSGKALDLRVEVSSSTSETPEIAELNLKGPGHAASRMGGNHHHG
jgi:hypothetical protein